MKLVAFLIYLFRIVNGKNTVVDYCSCLKLGLKKNQISRCFINHTKFSSEYSHAHKYMLFESVKELQLDLDVHVIVNK